MYRNEENDQLNGFIFFELCGSWQNLYQKRYAYQSQQVGIFEFYNNDGGWTCSEVLSYHVIYIVENTDHLRRIARISLSCSFERFYFDYDAWRCPNPRTFEPREIIENSQTARHLAWQYEQGGGA